MVYIYTLPLTHGLYGTVVQDLQSPEMAIERANFQAMAQRQMNLGVSENPIYSLHLWPCW